MLDRDRMNFRVAQQKGAIDQMRLRQQITGKPRRSVKGIGKGSFQSMHGLLRRVNRNCVSTGRAESPEIIEAHNVVRMRMRIKDGIQILDLRAEDLNSELGAGVYDPGSVRALHINRGAEPLITRIIGLANVALAT